jgi:phosphoenolpyruvate carboxykinase (ATP)
MVYAEWLAKRLEQLGTDVWLLNTGWTGGPYGVGHRFPLKYTRAFVTAILDGSLSQARFEPDPLFGLAVPDRVPGVPAEMLHPRGTWKDPAGYDEKARDLAQRFRANDEKFEVSPEVRKAGPRV